MIKTIFGFSFAYADTDADAIKVADTKTLDNDFFLNIIIALKVNDSIANTMEMRRCNLKTHKQDL